MILLVGATSCKRKADNASGTDSSLTEQIRKDRIEHNKKILDMASKAHDNYTQLYALYNLMADDSANNLKNMDSVAEIYLKLNMGMAALKMSEKILVKDPENERMLELKAEGDMSMNKDEEALNINRKLFDKTKKLKYLFNIANVQMHTHNMKDLGETLDHIKTSPTYQKDSIEVADNQNGTLQKVPDPAVMSYIEAMLLFQKNKMNEGAAKLKQAIDIYPQYINARRDMQALIQQSQRPQKGQ